LDCGQTKESSESFPIVFKKSLSQTADCDIIVLSRIKEENVMKKTLKTIAVILGILTAVAGAAAAVYYFLKKREWCCCGTDGCECDCDCDCECDCCEEEETVEQA
jgi:hypothetical protein